MPDETVVPVQAEVLTSNNSVVVQPELASLSQGELADSLPVLKGDEEKQLRNNKTAFSTEKSLEKLEQPSALNKAEKTAFADLSKADLSQTIAPISVSHQPPAAAKAEEPRTAPSTTAEQVMYQPSATQPLRPSPASYAARPASAPQQFSRPAASAQQFNRPAANTQQYGRSASGWQQYSRPASGQQYSNTTPVVQQYSRPVSGAQQYTNAAPGGQQYNRPVPNAQQNGNPSPGGMQYNRPASGPQQYNRPSSGIRGSTIVRHPAHSSMVVRQWALSSMVGLCRERAYALQALAKECDPQAGRYALE